jgi:hypothetical protein
MGFFKSTAKMEDEAFAGLAQQCAADAKKQIDAMMLALRNAGDLAADGKVTTINKVFHALYGHDIGRATGQGVNAQSALMELRLNTTFQNGYLYYLYLNLLIKRIQTSSDRYLSRNVFEEVEKHRTVSSLFRPHFLHAYPQCSAAFEKVERLVYGNEWGSLSVSDLYALKVD